MRFGSYDTEDQVWVHPDAIQLVASIVINDFQDRRWKQMRANLECHCRVHLNVVVAPRSGAELSSALTQQAVSTPRGPVPNERRRRRAPPGRTGTTRGRPPAVRGSPPALS